MPRTPPRRRLELLCWAVALLCGAGYVGGRALGEHEHDAALAAFHSAAASHAVALPESPRSDAEQALVIEAGVAGHISVPAPDTRDWSLPQVERFQQAVSADDGAESLPLAVLHIPRLSLQVPVYSEISERNLNRGAAVVPPPDAAEENRNLAIAGHRDSWFRGLKDVEVGDVIELQDLGSRRRFRIQELSVVEPTDLSPLAPTDESSLTLVTCYPFYFVGSAPQRFIVRATAEP